MKRHPAHGCQVLCVTTQPDVQAVASLARERAAASADAATAAAAAGISVRVDLDDSAIRRVQELVSEVWSATDRNALLSSEILHAFQHSGNYVAMAVHGNELVGAAVGFLGREPEPVHLHSHMTGVARNRQVGSVGFALKMHQRAWCLERGITSVIWTFDPLVRRNAYFNLVKLGAQGSAFHADFYGVMTDGLNAHDVSDRMVVEWDLLNPVPRTGEASIAHKMAEPWLVVDAENSPKVLSTEAEYRFCDIPDDLVRLRQQGPTLVRRWREAVRVTLGAAVADGGRVVSFSRDRGYLVRRS